MYVIKCKLFTFLVSIIYKKITFISYLKWDYQTLSNYSDRRITPSKAITLCQIAHGDYFSTIKWEQFLGNRVEGKQAPLAWNDLRVYLCVPQGTKRPVDQPNQDDSIKRLKLSLNQNEIRTAEMQGELEAQVNHYNYRLCWCLSTMSYKLVYHYIFNCFKHSTHSNHILYRNALPI